MRNTRGLGAAALLVVLAACSSIPMGTAGKLRSLDYLNDDVASLLLAFDLPPALEPIPGASTVSFDLVTPSSGERHVKATLVVADADELAGTLPPPSGDRNYYLFGFSETDKAAIRAAQAWARTLPPGANSMSVSLSPSLCRTEPIEPAKTTVSALIALPGAPGLSPLLSNMPLSTVLAAAPNKDIPPCAGHSG
ncbi:MAG: hypothetical protein J0I99_03935 [Devosia sp.]|uniref:hypothetical protein n=1 Tax=Devosia sp. TaxID=1871048 RepID=UPI001AC814CF|nr:hypothetical protein [Devosia sp.]MBN9311068.1 hypothetical protein [Devosia sp.]MBN9314865.1 hypothetical protein [Devosia sp.]